MRIMQIIDSLEAGGAERMAVNYANALTKQIDFSCLVSTRKEGPLLEQLNKDVLYLFLNKKIIFDVKALLLLRRFAVKNKVTVVHAHSSSFFLAFQLKLLCPSLKIVWHDHYGDSDFLNSRGVFPLVVTLPFFYGIIAVNHKLKNWANKKLYFKNTIYLPNFPSKENAIEAVTLLKGVSGKRIVCLANLRAQKNHCLVVEIARKLKLTHPEWSFHLIGKDFEDGYSDKIKGSIVQHNLTDTVFVYGSKKDIKNILDQATIGVLTSKSEGLPVALLEYGWSKKPVVVTDVGEISSIIKDKVNGFIVPSLDEIAFYNAIVELIGNDFLQNKLGEALYQTIEDSYSEDKVIKQYLNWLKIC